MKKLIYIVFFLFVGLNTYAQDRLPAHFKEEVEKEYRSMSQQVIEEELKMDMEQYYEFRKGRYLSRAKFQELIIQKAQRKGVNDLCANGTFESGEINEEDWNFYWAGGNKVTPIESGTDRKNSGVFNPSSGQNGEGWGGGTIAHSEQAHHQVVGVGSDPTFTALSQVNPDPAGNTHSLRLGNKVNAYGEESIAKVITVNNNNDVLTFSYAFVTQNPENHGSELPYFAVNIIDANDPTINYNSLVNLGGGSNRIRADHPLLTPNNTTAATRWKDWSCVTVDLSSLRGKTIIIEFYNRDCWQGAHWAYTYLDNLCLGCGVSNEGSLELNEGRSDTCGIPGNICVNYALPEGDDPSLDIDLELIQNGTVVTTLHSPTIQSDGTYCFSLDPNNTNGLNTSLDGFDYKVIGHPKLGNFTLSPKVIGSSGQGVKQGENNDYLFNCAVEADCCETDLRIWSRTSDTLAVQNGVMDGTEVSLAQETFVIHQNANIPITDLKVDITDIQFNYNYDQCASCITNPSLWGGIYSNTNHIGTVPNDLTLDPPFSTNTIANDIHDRKHNREIIWKNPNGAMLQDGDSFNLMYLLPPASEIPCCVTEVTICVKISWKDANCKVCEIYTCTTIRLDQVRKKR